MTDNLIYQEKLTSHKTEALFITLSVLFLLLFLVCIKNEYADILAIVSFCFFSLFLFYSLNYRTLIIQLTTQSLRLRFGIFSWGVCLDNIEACELDEIPLFKRMGGAGIHFMSIRNRYRASFNFLEYPRVVVALKRKAGLVRDISFSTRQPYEVIRIIHETLSD